MKTTGQQKGKIAEATKKHNGSLSCAGVKNSTNRRRGLHKNTRETTKEILAVELKTSQFNPTKIKLQLFPIDEGTHSGLAKDGHNPFLELTLSARKKISSVLTHINTKWGGSSVALGEPMLFPNNVRLDNPATSRRWTLKDTGINAGDVYEAVGNPAIFRLRYGWYSSLEPQRMPSTPTPFACIEAEDTQKACNSTSKISCDWRKQIEITGKKNLIDASEAADAVVAGQMSLAVPVDSVDDEVTMDNGLPQSIATWSDCFTNLSIGGLLSEASLQGKINKCDLKSNGSRSGVQPIPLFSDISIGGLLSEASLQEKINNHESVSDGSKLGLEQSPFLWDDNLTTLSIGGLLSEASLQGKINNSDPKSNESKPVVQPLALISDSFDAIIAAQMNSHPQAAKPLSHDSHSSILDAEETCHAFSFRKFSSSGKNLRLSGRARNDASSNSFKFPSFAELNKQAALAEDPPCQESKEELLSLSQVCNEDNSSLGLTGIKWNDSLGPFDLGLSTLRHVSGGDSIGISGIVR